MVDAIGVAISTLRKTTEPEPMALMAMKWKHEKDNLQVRPLPASTRTKKEET